MIEESKSNKPGAEKSDNFRILVAEDVDTNQQIVVEMLQLLGHEVDVASNGEVAVAKYFSNKYSLIFMDCQMPIMDGYEATEKIRAIESERKASPLPIIALTAGSDKEDRDRCKRAGMNGYLTKPFSISDLQESIERQLQPNFSRKRVPGMIDKERSNKTTLEDSTAPLRVLNLSAIESIRDVERQTGKLLLPSIFEGYVNQMENKLTEIEQNASHQDSISIFRAAHAIKSMSANIGAEKVRNISSQIEKKAREEDLSGLTEALKKLTQAYHEFVERFDAELAKQT
jgi:CheY-like chemotaxis protein